jgi:hypothetical protein
MSIVNIVRSHLFGHKTNSRFISSFTSLKSRNQDASPLTQLSEEELSLQETGVIYIFVF